MGTNFYDDFEHLNSSTHGRKGIMAEFIFSRRLLSHILTIFLPTISLCLVSFCTSQFRVRLQYLHLFSIGVSTYLQIHHSAFTLQYCLDNECDDLACFDHTLHQHLKFTANNLLCEDDRHLVHSDLHDAFS